MASLLVRLTFNIIISQCVKRRLAIQNGQTVSNFYRKKIRLLFIRLVAG